MKFKTYYNSKSARLVNDIIATEELEVNVEIAADALGDTVIIVSGSKEEVKILKAIYEMVS